MQYNPKDKAQVQTEDFKTFSELFTLAQLLEKGDKGVIFIGNSRAGKTTLSCAAAGAKIIIKHDSSYQLTFLHPTDEPFAKLVRDTNQSVTTTPNFFKHNQLAIVDMPGYDDSSKLKRLINYHYIKTMITNLKQIRFLVVITMPYSDGKYQLEAPQKRMLQSFADTFPECRDCVNIIINRVQHSNDGLKQKEGEVVKAAFRNLLNDKQSQKIKKYFEFLTNDKIHVIFRPPYKQNKDCSDWNEQYTQITQTMKSICFDSTAKFINIMNLKTKVHIFKEGDNIENNKFRDKLLQILQEEANGTAIVKDCFQSIVVLLMTGLVFKNISDQEYQIEQILTAFQNKDKTKQYQQNQKLININSQNLNYSMVQSKIIRLLISLFDVKINIGDPAATQTNILQGIHFIFAQLSSLTTNLFPQNKKLKQRMNYLHIYTVRRLKQAFFIYKCIDDQKIVDVSKMKDMITQEIIFNLNQLNKFEKYIVEFRQYLQIIADSIFKIDLKTKFGNHFPQSIKKELIETLKNIQFLYQKRLFTQQTKLIDMYIVKADDKIKEIELYYDINITPIKPEEIKSYIEKLLSIYHTIQKKDQKLKIAHKLALNLAKTQPKYAIALSFHLEMNEEVLRLIELLYDPKKNETKKNELVFNWYLQLAQEFKAKKRAYYFERCLQKAKLFCSQDVDKLTEIVIKLGQGLNSINNSINNEPPKNVSTLKNIKNEIYDWSRIDEEIAFLKVLYKRQKKARQYKVIGQKFRQ